MLIKRNCVSCGKEFSTESSRLISGRGKYCSVVCRGLARRAKPIKRQCLSCKKEFGIIPRLLKISKGLYCSYSCFWNDRRGKETMPFGERLASWIRFPANENSCAIWMGHLTRGGYGKISKLVNGKCASVRSHRAVYELYFGLFDPSVEVLHSCDNPPCCNIRHLFIGSQQDNMSDKISKNRHAKGETMGNAKLTTREVIRIKSLIERGEKQKNIAAQFDASEATISAIKLGKIWKHVP